MCLLLPFFIFCVTPIFSLQLVLHYNVFFSFGLFFSLPVSLPVWVCSICHTTILSVNRPASQLVCPVWHKLLILLQAANVVAWLYSLSVKPEEAPWHCWWCWWRCDDLLLLHPGYGRAFFVVDIKVILLWRHNSTTMSLWRAVVFLLSLNCEIPRIHN